MCSPSSILYGRTFPILGLFAFLFFVVEVRAQSSLFNIPTAETLTKGEGYVEADLDAHFAPLRNGGWQSYGVLTVYGLNNRTEFGVNAYATRSVDGFSSVELQPNLKFKAYENESLGLTVSVGAIGYVPVRGGKLRDTQVSIYSVVGKSFDKDWTPRLTAGAYKLAGSDIDGTSRGGFLLAVQQPVHKRIELIADWNTGKNRFGYAAAGVGLTLTKKSYLYSAYYFGNEGRANNSLGVYYGFTF